MAPEEPETYRVPEDGPNPKVTLGAEIREFHGKDVLIEAEHAADRSMDEHDFYDAVRPLLSDSDVNENGEKFAVAVYELVAEELETEAVHVTVRISGEREAGKWKTVELGKPIPSTVGTEQTRD